MVDHESRDIKTNLRIMYAFQFQVPIGHPRIILAHSMRDACQILEDMGLDAVSIVRVGEVL